MPNYTVQHSDLTYDPVLGEFVLTLQRRGTFACNLDWGVDVSTWLFKLQIRAQRDKRSTVLLEKSTGNGIVAGSTANIIHVYFSATDTDQSWTEAFFDFLVTIPGAEPDVSFLPGLVVIIPTVTR